MENRTLNFLSVTFLLGLFAVLAVPRAAEADSPKVVAVFLLESRGSPLKADEAVGLTDFMSAKLGSNGRLQIIPRDELKKRIQASKGQSYKECFDSSCQIELGREMAAQFSISSAVTKVGSQCLITASVWDLRKATQIRAASRRGKCDADSLIEAVEVISETLEAAMTGGTMPKVASRPVVSPPKATPLPVAQPRPVVVAPTPAMAPASGPASSSHLALSKTVFAPDDTIEVKWHGTTSGKNDWVDVVPDGTPDDEAGGYLEYLRKASGSFRVSGLTPGTYYARVYLDYDTKGYAVADRLAFQVVAPDQTPSNLAVQSKYLGLTQPAFSTGQPIEIHWFNTPGVKYDWITVVPKDASDDTAGDNYFYTTTPAGTQTIEALGAGEYEIRFFLDYSNKGYTVSDRLGFTVQ